MTDIIATLTFVLIVLPIIAMMVMHIRSRMRWVELHDRIEHLGEDKWYGYRHSPDIRTVYHHSVNEDVWGIPIALSETAFGSRRRIININDPGND